MKGYVNGQMVTLVKDHNTGKWVPNAVAVADNQTTAVANPINPLDVSEDYKRGFVEAFNQLGAVLDGVADTGELQAALDQYRSLRAQGVVDPGITFQGLMELIQGARQRRGISNPRSQAIGNRNVARIGNR
jgi:hypothetical protein